MNIEEYKFTRKVSVIIPVYNAEKYISETLDSVIAQNYPDIEIILIDDCSTDNSAQIIRDYMSKYSCIKYYKQDNNSFNSEFS